MAYTMLAFASRTLSDVWKWQFTSFDCKKKRQTGRVYTRNAPYYLDPKALLPVYWCRGWKIHPQPNTRSQSTRTGGNTVITPKVSIKLVQPYCYVNYHSCHRKTFMGHYKSCLEGKNIFQVFVRVL